MAPLPEVDRSTFSRWPDANTDTNERSGATSGYGVRRRQPDVLTPWILARSCAATILPEWSPGRISNLQGSCVREGVAVLAPLMCKGKDRGKLIRWLREMFGRRLRAARLPRGLTQAETAEQLDISVEFYSRMEGSTALPSLWTLIRLKNCLGVTFDYLLDTVGRPVPDASTTPAETMLYIVDGLLQRPELVRVLFDRLKKMPEGPELYNLLTVLVQALGLDAPDT